MSIKPNRGELLDAIAEKIHLIALEGCNTIADVIAERRKEIAALSEERDNKKIKLERFEASRVRLESKFNEMLRQSGFGEIKLELSTKAGKDANHLCPMLQCWTSIGKQFKTSPTKVLDKKINDIQNVVSDLTREHSILSQKANRYDPTYERRRRERHNAIISRMLKKDPDMIAGISKAAKSMTGDIDEIVNTVLNDNKKAKKDEPRRKTKKAQNQVN